MSARYRLADYPFSSSSSSSSDKDGGIGSSMIYAGSFCLAMLIYYWYIHVIDKLVVLFFDISILLKTLLC
jgi:hypothetical protein